MSFFEGLVIGIEVFPRVLYLGLKFLGFGV